ncbi:MAG: hypothetical protein ACT4NP_06170 [Pseudonocardiales bacterium]
MEELLAERGIEVDQDGRAGSHAGGWPATAACTSIFAFTAVFLAAMMLHSLVSML